MEDLYTSSCSKGPGTPLLDSTEPSETYCPLLDSQSCGEEGRGFYAAFNSLGYIAMR